MYTSLLKKYLQVKILDVGCGQGRHLILMQAGSVGIDLYQNKDMITKYNLAIHYLNDNLPFKNESFDVLFCSHVLFIAIKKVEKVYLLPSKRNLLEKILRKLFGNAMSQYYEEK